jgi:hypothetical protein
VSRAHFEALACLLVNVDRAGLGIGERHRLGDDRGEDGSEIESGIDGLAHLAERAQFLDRLRQFPRPQLHLSLEVRIGLLQAASHLVELVG